MSGERYLDGLRGPLRRFSLSHTKFPRKFLGYIAWRPDDSGRVNYRMRILIRKGDQPLYLQGSGEWSINRETARDFQTSMVAWRWAREHQLFGTEILLAFEDPLYDVVPLRL